MIIVVPFHVGTKAVMGNVSEVVIAPILKWFSTTGIIERMKGMTNVE